MPTGSILVVDDEASVLETLQAILELDGHIVTAVGTGRAALEVLKTQIFDLVLTDLRLDDLSGMEIIAELKRVAPDTVAIVLTGYASLDSAVQAIREGAYDYLFKPTNVDELRLTVGRAIDKRRLSLELRDRLRDLEEANATIQQLALTLSARLLDLQVATDAIQRLNASLQQRVGEATAELTERVQDLAHARDEISALYHAAEAHVDQLQQLDRLKSQFLSMASHELKTPLTAMSINVQMALRRARRNVAATNATPEDRQRERDRDIDQLDMINSQTQKVNRLIDELLDVSRIEGGMLELHFEPVDLYILAQEVVGRLQTLTGTHEIRLTPAMVSGAIVNADRDHLERVLNNLIGNAIKYSPEGGQITLTISLEGDQVVLSLQDQGSGIDPSDLEHIFDLFYRSSDEATRRTSGMGLGLYISKEIVAQHGGRIWAESAQGAGSTFYVSLPRMA